MHLEQNFGIYSLVSVCVPFVFQKFWEDGAHSNAERHYQRILLSKESTALFEKGQFLEIVIFNGFDRHVCPLLIRLARSFYVP